MTGILVYAAIALSVIILAGALIRQAQRGRDFVEAQPRKNYAQGLSEGASWRLAERLFDPADYLWLRNKVRFPHLAQALARSRKQTALELLKDFKKSFDDLVRVSEPEPPSERTNDASQSWRLLLLVLRFHCVLGYATLVVRFFGPYHRLVPSLDWLSIASQANYSELRYGTPQSGPTHK